MKKVLLSAIMTVCGLGYTYANVSLDRSVLGIERLAPKENTDKIIIITKTASEQTNKMQAGKARVMVQEIENDDLGLENASNMKEVEVSSTKFTDDNFVYVKERKDLIGYALQLASFSDLSLAKDYALSITHKGDAEKRQLFIYSVNTTEKTFYKVYYGLLKSDESAREKQRTFLSLGYSPFVKEFR
jgi:SPOR domain